MPASGSKRAEADGTGAPLVIQRSDRAPLGGLLLVIAIVWLAAAMRGFDDGHPAIVPGLGTAGAYVAGALGAAFAVLAVHWLIRARTVTIGCGRISVTARSLLGRHAWHEPLANYREIRVEREQRPHRYGALHWYVVRLCHPRPDRGIELARAKDPALIARCARQYAARCGLPLSWRWDEGVARHGLERAGEIAAARVVDTSPVG